MADHIPGSTIHTPVTIADFKHVYFGSSRDIDLSHLEVDYGAAGVWHYLYLKQIADTAGLCIGTTSPPICPGTGKPFALTVAGDILVGDISIIEINPIQIGQRVTDLTTATPTSYYSNRLQNSDIAGGASITLFSDETGAVDSGYINITAYGRGTGTLANTVRFMTRNGANSAAERARIGDTGLVIDNNLALQFVDTGGVARSVIVGGNVGDPVTFFPMKSGGIFQWNNYANSQNNMVLDDAGNLMVKLTLQINAAQVVGARIVNAGIAAAIEAAFTALYPNASAVLAALQSGVPTHGLITAA